MTLLCSFDKVQSGDNSGVQRTHVYIWGSLNKIGQANVQLRVQQHTGKKTVVEGSAARLVAEHLDEGGAEGGAPQGDDAVGVAQLHDGVPGVLAHAVAGPHPRAVLRHYLPRARVLARHRRAPPAQA